MGGVARMDDVHTTDVYIKCWIFQSSKVWMNNIFVMHTWLLWNMYLRFPHKLNVGTNNTGRHRFTTHTSFKHNFYVRTYTYCRWDSYTRNTWTSILAVYGELIGPPTRLMIWNMYKKPPFSCSWLLLVIKSWMSVSILVHSVPKYVMISSAFGIVYVKMYVLAGVSLTPFWYS